MHVSASAHASSTAVRSSHSSRTSERNRQVIRQWELLLVLQDCPQSTGALARQLQVTTRTIYRDLAALQAARFPLYVDEGGRWRLLSRGFVPARLEARS